MKYATISAVQATIINNARKFSSEDERRAIKKELFACIKARFGIPQDFKCKVETDSTKPDYLLLKVGQKTPPGVTGDLFALRDDGKWVLAPKMIEAPEPAKRWFYVGSTADFMSMLAREQGDFDDGHDALEDVVEQVTVNGVAFAKDDQGGVFAQLPETLF